MKIISSGATKYKILMPSTPTDFEIFAKNEFVDLFKLSTGITLDVVTQASEEDFCFSIGNNEMLEKCAVSLSSQQLKDSDFYLFSQGNQIFMIGNCGYGTIYAVYEFFSKFFCYRYFAESNIAIDKLQELELEHFNYAVSPDIPNRTLGYIGATWQENSPYLHRLRVSKNWATGWAIQSHSYFLILPKDKYFASNRDFYSPRGDNLCLTNKSMIAEFTTRLKDIILQHPDSDYIMLGQEDNYGFCDCDNCRREVELYGTESAVMMRFVNNVAREIKQFTIDKQLKKQITLVSFAYNKTYDAPSVLDRDTQEYKATHSSVIAEDNVAIMFVPYYSTTCYSHNMLDEKYNRKTRHSLLSWKAVTSRLMIWEYNTNFTYYLYPFANWRTMSENYNIYKKIGVEFIFIEGNHETGSSYFYDMKLYVQTKLMWDSTLDYNELVDDFMKNYYKTAYPQMKCYFDLVLSRWDYIEREYNLLLKSVYYWDEREYWSQEYLDYCLSLIHEAIDNLEPLKASNAELYTDLHNKLLLETLSPRYMLINLYGDSYTDYDLVVEEFLSDCKQFGIDRFGQGNSQVLFRQDINSGFRETYDENFEGVSVIK